RLNPARVAKFFAFHKGDTAALRSGKSLLRAVDSAELHLWFFAVPFIAKGSERALVALLAGDALNALLAAVKTKGSAVSLYAAMLVDPDKRLVAHSESRRFKPYQDMANHPAVDAAFRLSEKNIGTGVLRYAWNGEHEYGSFRKLNSGAILITTVNEGIAFEGVRWARITTILIALIILCLAVLFIYFFSRTISDPLKSLVEATNRVRAGQYDTRVEASSRDEVGELAQAFNEMTEGLREREQLKGAFGKFVNEEVARMVLRGDLALGGELKTATVLFSDIRSFTTISEKLNPAEVVAFLNEYLSLMVEVIHQNGGIVDKFIGDAIMAVWGAPVSRDNDVENAVAAALGMRQALLEFNRKRGGRGKPAIRIGIGINTGEVLAGQIGSENRLEYTVIGDTVNLASRLEGLTKFFGADILIAQSTYDLVKKQFACIPLKRVLVKGKSEAQRVYAVLGRLGDPAAPKTLNELHKLTGLYPQKKLEL
ncbi:MAG: adenylate/guanylate cyclase domain-containing protein, partial [Leptospiraceae bacterium]|nr:adenylate/guanylate cyclase domain-containing protein [Leptospiraceae bacterium]